MKRLVMFIPLTILGMSLWSLNHARAQKEIPQKRLNAQELNAMQDDQEANVPDRIIYLKARQFSFSPDTIIVKQGDRIRIIAESLDVAHGFAIAEFKVNATIEAGKQSIIEFIAHKKGKYDFVCSVYCGPGHSSMKGTLIVE